MKRWLTIPLLALIFASPWAAAADLVKVRMETTLGNLVLELDREQAPLTVANFLDYVEEGYYDGTIFHRVIPKFMIQGGGFTPDMKQKATHEPIDNEADNGLTNARGTIAMARTMEPHSATAQFFINVVDNDALNHRDKSTRGWGYAVFGKVVNGMKVADRIVAVPTTSHAMHRDVPKEPIVIEKVTVLE